MAGKFGFDDAIEMAAEAVEFAANPKMRDSTLRDLLGDQT